MGRVLVGDRLSEPESAYDAAAARFDWHRALPDGVAEAIRSAILNAMSMLSPPRLLDLGAGTGRIGHAFVTTGDDYIGADLSLGMLREFAKRGRANAPRLVQADGARLPFADASFDAVMMMQVLGAAWRSRSLVDEALRVLRAPGTLVFGHSVMPRDGLDAKMKKQLASLLAEMGASPYHTDARSEVIGWLGCVATSSTRVVAAEWDTTRTPAGFLKRQPTGAQFAQLPQWVRDEALAKLGAWAAATFGSLDAELQERHLFELSVFKFQQGRC